MKRTPQHPATSNTSTGQANDKRPFWVRWYKTAAWQRLRLWQLQRQPLCEFHLDQGRTVSADTVDHRQPHKGNKALFFDRGNLTSLCKPCHSSIKQKMEKRGEYGCDVNGMVAGWKDGEE